MYVAVWVVLSKLKVLVRIYYGEVYISPLFQSLTFMWYFVLEVILIGGMYSLVEEFFSD